MEGTAQFQKAKADTRRDTQPNEQQADVERTVSDDTVPEVNLFDKERL